MVSFEDGKFILRRRDDQRYLTNTRRSKVLRSVLVALAFAAWYFLNHRWGEGSLGWLRGEPDSSMLRAARDANVRPVSTSKLSPVAYYVARDGVRDGVSESRDSVQSAGFNTTDSVETLFPSLESNPLARISAFQNNRGRTIQISANRQPSKAWSTLTHETRGSRARNIASSPERDHDSPGLDHDNNHHRNEHSAGTAPSSPSSGERLNTLMLSCWLGCITLIKLLL